MQSAKILRPVQPPPPRSAITAATPIYSVNLEDSKPVPPPRGSVPMSQVYTPPKPGYVPVYMEPSVQDRPERTIDYISHKKRVPPPRVSPMHDRVTAERTRFYHEEPFRSRKPSSVKQNLTSSSSVWSVFRPSTAAADGASASKGVHKHSVHHIDHVRSILTEPSGETPGSARSGRKPNVQVFQSEGVRSSLQYEDRPSTASAAAARGGISRSDFEADSKYRYFAPCCSCRSFSHSQ